MARKKIKSSTDQRPFVMVYQDCLDSKVINCHEKMVFIALKRFADGENQCFPSLKRLSDVTGLSKRKIQDTLKALEQKHIITITNKTRTDGGFASNLYTLYDYKELWQTENSTDTAAIIEKMSEDQMIAALEEKGYQVIKTKKELISTAESNEMSSNNIQFITDYNILQHISQPISVDQIKNQIGYDAITVSGDVDQRDLDAVVNIIHEAVTTTKESIRVGGEDKPAQVVYSRLMQLNREDIIYVLRKLEAAERGGTMVKNHEAYLLTQLYKAKDQRHLEHHNLGRLNGDF